MTADAPRPIDIAAEQQRREHRPKTDAELEAERLQRAARPVDSPLRKASAVRAFQGAGAANYDKANDVVRELLHAAYGVPLDDPLVLEGADGYVVAISFRGFKVRVVRRGNDDE